MIETQERTPEGWGAWLGRQAVPYLHGGSEGVEDLKCEIRQYTRNCSTTTDVALAYLFTKLIDKVFPGGDDDVRTLLETVYYSAILSILKNVPEGRVFDNSDELIAYVANTFVSDHVAPLFDDVQDHTLTIEEVRAACINRFLPLVQTNTFLGQALIGVVAPFITSSQVITVPVETFVTLLRAAYDLPRSEENPFVQRAEHGVAEYVENFSFTECVEVKSALKVLHEEQKGLLGELFTVVWGIVENIDQKRIDLLVDAQGPVAAISMLRDNLFYDLLPGQEHREYVLGLLGKITDSEYLMTVAEKGIAVLRFGRDVMGGVAALTDEQQSVVSELVDAALARGGAYGRAEIFQRAWVKQFVFALFSRAKEGALKETLEKALQASSFDEILALVGAALKCQEPIDEVKGICDHLSISYPWRATGELVDNALLQLPKIHAKAAQFREVGKAARLVAMLEEPVQKAAAEALHEQGELAGVNIQDILDTIAFDPENDFSPEVHSALAALATPLIDDLFAENKWVVEELLHFVCGLIVSNGEGSADEELGRFVGYLIPKVRALVEKKRAKFEEVHNLWNQNNVEDFGRAMLPRVQDSLASFYKIYPDGAVDQDPAKALKLRDLVLRQELKKELENLYKELLQDWVHEQVDTGLYQFLQMIGKEAMGASVVGNLVVHFGEDLLFNAPEQARKARAAKEFVEQKFPGMGEIVEKICSERVVTGDALYDAAIGALAGDTYLASYLPNLTWILLEKFAQKEGSVEALFDAMYVAQSKLDEEEEPAKVFEEFLNVCIGLEELNALLPRVVREQGAISMLIDSGAEDFVKLVNHWMKPREMNPLAPMIQAEVLRFVEGNPAQKALVGAALQTGALKLFLDRFQAGMQNQGVLNSLLQVVGNFAEGKELPSTEGFAATLVDTLFPADVPGGREALVAGIQAGLKNVEKLYDTPEKRKALVLEALGAENGESIEAFLQERVSSEISASVPWLLNNFLFRFIFWPLTAIFCWYVSRKVNYAAEQLDALLENEGFTKLIPALGIQFVEGASAENLNGELGRILGHFGVPSFAARFIPLEDEPLHALAMRELQKRQVLETTV